MRSSFRRGLLMAFSMATAFSLPALADRGGHHHWSGDIRNFSHHDLPTWRTGYWHNGPHAGRVGWWWVVGGLWYFYPTPVYPYPDPYVPPVVVVNAPPAAVTPAPLPQPAPALAPAAPQYWYYCDASKGYYPYVTLCPGGWQAVPATPAPQ